MRMTLFIACLSVAAGVAGPGRAGEKADAPLHQNGEVQAVIDEVEKTCLEGPVYMIGPRKAKRLAKLVRRRKPKVVVECGTALGYSGLWIARELKAAGQGKLITIEIDPQRAKQAEANFRKAGLGKLVTVKVGDARKVVKQLEGPIDFVFLDCGYSNYLPCFQGLEKKLSEGAIVVADNVCIGARGTADYLKLVRSKYQSHTEWFDLDLPWAKRDAMEVTVITQGRLPFLGWPEDKSRKIGDRSPQSALAWITNMTKIQLASYDRYEDSRSKGGITVEMTRDGYVYFAIRTGLCLPGIPTGDGSTASVFVSVTERFKAKIPTGQPH